jgi:alpha/beta hydrolase fold
MVAWLQPKYRFGALLQPQLSSTARAQQQADQLRTILGSTGQTGFVVVGHSMGGLVARRAAQQDPTLINGVLTVGTPHQGAYLALQTEATVTEGIRRIALGMYTDLGCTYANQNLPCFFAAVAYHFVTPWLAGKVDDPLNFPATQDLKAVQYASNPFITNLNAAAESFTRVGIQSYPSKRWVVFRLVGDNRHNPEETWGGRFYVKVASDVSGSLKACFIGAAIFGRWNTFKWCKLGYDGMQNIDAVWNDFTAPHEGKSDGVVQGSSQLYPGGAVNYTIPGGDSHLGEPKSDRTRPIIEQAFNVNFNVPKP